ncbi:MAG: thermonuclease family protein [Roseibium sp.]|uniref:thermonuclease family protein n=1 Tax=Roseibium sp. TaxID=1936156 RepID=UPI003298585A
MPFFVRPRDYSVIDGDTIRILAPKGPMDKWRPEAFSVRFRSIAAPEKPKPEMTDKIMKSVGIDPHADNAGIIAKNALKDLLKGRCLMIEPKGADRYKRTLGDISASGTPGKSFDLNNAFSVEQRMIDGGIVTRFSNEEELPPYYSYALKDLRDRVAPISAGPSF